MAEANEVPLGDVSLVEDGAAIEAFIEDVGDDTLQLMRTTWQRYASKKFTDLFDADPEEETDILSGQTE